MGKPIEFIKSHSITFLLLQIDQIHLEIFQGSVKVLIKIGIEEESAKERTFETNWSLRINLIVLLSYSRHPVIAKYELLVEE
jgi:hypothetical protein